MNNKTTIKDIRCCVIHYLNCRGNTSNFTADPVIFLEHHPAYLAFKMAVFLNLNEKFSNNNESYKKPKESEGQQPCYPVWMLPSTIYKGGDSYGQIIKRETFIKHYFGEMLATEKEHLLSNSRIEWIKRDRSQIYILMKEIENHIIQSNSKRLLERKLQRVAQYTLQPYGIIKLSKSTEVKYLFDSESIYLNGANLSRLSLLTNEEIYLNLLLLLDNTFYVTGLNNRNNFMMDLKAEYMKTTEKMRKVQKLIVTQKINIKWIYDYWLKKISKDEISPYNISNTPDKHHLDFLIYHFFKDFKGDVKQIEARISKAWSEKKIRDRKSSKNNTINLSQKDYDDLDAISKRNGKTKKETIKGLIKQERQRLAVYGVLK
jgi:hypothetical protein